MKAPIKEIQGKSAQRPYNNVENYIHWATTLSFICCCLPNVRNSWNSERIRTYQRRGHPRSSIL